MGLDGGTGGKRKHGFARHKPGSPWGTPFPNFLVGSPLWMSLVPGMRAIAARCAPTLASITHAVRVPGLSSPATALATPPASTPHPIAAHPAASQARGVACAAGVGAAAPAPFKLVVYSKADCPLCDKLKEKLDAIQARAAFAPSVLAGVAVEVRDIAGDPAWEAAYSMEVPVMRIADPDGGNEVRIVGL